MDKTLLLKDAERVIKHYQMKIQTLNSIEPGYLYEFKAGNNTYLARLSTFNGNVIRWNLFACNGQRWNISIHESFPYDITNIRKVNPKDLALYVDWSWKSPEFGKLLNGTSRIRLKKFEGD